MISRAFLRGSTVRMAALLILFAPAGSSEHLAGAQIVVYVEVPDDATPRTVLRLSFASLRGSDGDVRLDPVETEIDSGAIRGSQLRLVDQSVPPGTYGHLVLGLDRAEIRAGAAAIQPSRIPSEVVIPIQINPLDGRTAFVLVRWHPEAADPARGEYVPRLETASPEVPPVGSLAFVTNEGSDNISVIDRISHRVVDVIRAGDRPRGMVASRDGQRIYVANAGSDEVLIVDTRTLRTIRRATLRYGDEPSRIALSPTEDAVYVLNYGSNILSILDAEFLRERDRVPVEEDPRGMDVDPTTGFIYVASELSHSILRVDPGRPLEPLSLSVGLSPLEVLLSARGEELFVSSANQRRFLVVGLDAGATTQRLNLCSSAVGLAFSPRSRQLYASLEGCREIAVLSPASGLEVGTITAPSAPGLISFDPEFRQLLVTYPSTNELAFCNVNSNQWAGTAKVGEAPYLALVPR